MKASTIAFGLEAPLATLEESGPVIGLDNTGYVINSVVDPADLANAGDSISYFFWV